MMGNLRIESLAAQVDVMEPVVEAALVYVNAVGRKIKGTITLTALVKAVQEYEEALKEDE